MDHNAITVLLIGAAIIWHNVELGNLKRRVAELELKLSLGNLSDCEDGDGEDNGN